MDIVILLAYSIPNLVAYDPAFAFELAVTIRDWNKRMYEDKEDVFYYITVMNENYPMPEMPGNVKDGIVKGMYKFHTSDKKNSKMSTASDSGTMNEVLKAKNSRG
jgi:pyruvate dehydrogenase E1 component